MSRQAQDVPDVEAIDGNGNAATATLADILNTLDLLTVVAIVLLTLTTVSIALRFYVRIVISRTFGPEDWSMVAVSLFAISEYALGISNARNVVAILNGDSSGAGHLAAVTAATGCFYILTMIGTKISLGFFFLRIFSHQRIQRYMIYVIMAVTAVSGIVYMPLGYGTCAQVKELPGSSTVCPVQTAANVFLGIFSIANILGTLGLTAIAIAALAQVRLPLATKVSAGLLVLIGSGGAVATAVRLAFTWKTTNPLQYTQEILYLTFLQQIEMGTGVIAANLALIRPLFHKFLVSLGIVSLTQPTQTTGARQFTNTAKSVTRRGKIEETGDELLLDEIKRDMTITVQIRDANGKPVEGV